MDKFYAGFVDFLTGNFEYSSELQSFWMAFQGVMIVRSGPNKDRQMNWFHAFMLSVICGYGGAMFGFIWMGKPSSMLSNDLNMASCILSFLIVNYLPFDIGYKMGNFIPVALVTTVFAQLFRSLGLVKFVGVAFSEFQSNPSRYYPIPVFGPILYGTLLGNMSSFFQKGFHEYLSTGMPWPFQNGLFCATFYHFYANDTTGPIGTAMRHAVHTYVPQLQGGLDDRTFAIAFVSLFMQIVGILHMPIFLGPNFSPFTLMGAIVYRVTSFVTPTGKQNQPSAAVAVKPIASASAVAPKKGVKAKKDAGGKTTTEVKVPNGTSAKGAATKETGPSQNGTAAMAAVKADSGTSKRKKSKKKVS